MTIQDQSLPSIVSATASRWQPLAGTALEALTSCNSVSALSRMVPTEVRISDGACGEAIAVMEVQLPLGRLGEESASSLWHDGGWNNVVMSGIGSAGAVQRKTERALKFITARIEVPPALATWQSISGGEELVWRVSEKGSCCVACAPIMPKLEWVLEGTQFAAVEDPYQAGVFERALKQRPSIFQLQLRRDGSDGRMRIAVNAVSLAERGFALLPLALQKRASDVRLSWRLVPTNDDAAVKNRLFRLTSNKADKQSEQPPGFIKANQHHMCMCIYMQTYARTHACTDRQNRHTDTDAFARTRMHTHRRGRA